MRIIWYGQMIQYGFRTSTYGVKVNSEYYYVGISLNLKHTGGRLFILYSIRSV